MIPCLSILSRNSVSIIVTKDEGSYYNISAQMMEEFCDNCLDGRTKNLQAVSLRIRIKSKGGREVKAVDHFVPLGRQDVSCHLAELQGAVHGHVRFALARKVESR